MTIHADYQQSCFFMLLIVMHLCISYFIFKEAVPFFEINSKHGMKKVEQMIICV